MKIGWEHVSSECKQNYWTKSAILPSIMPIHDNTLLSDILFDEMITLIRQAGFVDPWRLNIVAISKYIELKKILYFMLILKKESQSKVQK